MDIKILHELTVYKEKIQQLAEIAKASTSQQEIQEILEYIKIIKRKYRVLRSEHDVLFFAYEYFSAECNEENDDNLIPVGSSLLNVPNFHVELCTNLDKIKDEVTTKLCWSVPRGHAKSAYLSNVLPVHQIVYKLRHYILIVSETETMSQKFVEWIANQLKFNKKLREDFGDILSENKNANDTDNRQGFVTGTNIRVQSASIGKQLRGARHGAYRPDLVILDDLESAKNTNTKELRDKNLHWFNSVITPIGDPDRTAFIYMGTLVHGQGLLPAVLNRTDYKSKIYSAIVSAPTHPELWEKYEEMLRNVEDADREITADNFYFENQEAMDEGCETLWERRFSYRDLMKIKVNVGSRAFGSEYLNRPTDDETAIFKSSYFQFYEEKDLYYSDGRAMNMDIFGFFDIAIGKNDRSDYNAIVTVGRDKRTGVLYVLDAWAEKIPMHKALEVAEKKILQYRHKVFGVESVQAQYDTFRQLRDNLTKRNHYSTRLEPIIPKNRKEERIEELEPLVEAGTIRFKRSQRLLLEQLEQFPTGDHDDTCDALASAVQLAGKQRKRSYYSKPSGF